jgi:hypothetical protein
VSVPKPCIPSKSASSHATSRPPRVAGGGHGRTGRLFVRRRGHGRRVDPDGRPHADGTRVVLRTDDRVVDAALGFDSQPRQFHFRGQADELRRGGEFVDQ